MNQDARIRPAIDLDELEKQLRQAAPVRRVPTGDPLAELARIVGRDDATRERPADNARLDADSALLDQLRAVVGGDRKGAAPRIEPLFPDPATPPLRPAFAEDAPPAAVLAPDQHPAMEPAQAEHMMRSDALPEHAAYPIDQMPAEAAPMPRRASRKGLIIAGAVLGVAVVGVAAVLGLGRVSQPAVAAKEPPVITARPGPTKEKPANPGGVVVPNQNTQILERVQDSPSGSRTLPREEQPVDLAAVPKVESAPRQVLAGAPVIIATQPPVGASPSPGVVVPRASDVPRATDVSRAAEGLRGPDLPPPTRTVQSFVVAPPGAEAVAARPDPVAAAGLAPAGFPIAGASAPGASQPASRSVAPPGQTVASVATLPPADIASVAATPAVPRPVKAIPIRTDEAGEATAAARPAPQTSVAGTPVRPGTEAPRARPQTQTQTPTPASTPPRLAAAAPASDADGGPLRLTPAPGQRTAARVASVAPVATAPVGQEPAAAGGAFTIQLTAEGSEASARSAFNEMRGRFDALSGYSPNIRRAEVGGRTVYRVRVGSFSREEAVSVCEKLKAEGGKCFVARN